MMELSERIIKILERNEFNIGEITKQDEEFYLEYGQSTPEGEDWWETLWFDGTEEGFIKAFTDRANSFDVDEEAEVWIEARGSVRGVPDSIRDLIDDAEWKKKMLLKVTNDLEGIDNKDEEQNELNGNKKYAKIFCDAIRIMVDKPDNINNLESYLSNHFTNWLDLYGNNPEDISHELKTFAEMEIK